MIVLTHFAYWVTGLFIMAGIVGFVALTQWAEERWQARFGHWRSPARLRAIGNGIARVVPYILAAIFLTLFPYLIGSGLWNWGEQ